MGIEEEEEPGDINERVGGGITVGELARMIREEFERRSPRTKATEREHALWNENVPELSVFVNSERLEEVIRRKVKEHPEILTGIQLFDEIQKETGGFDEEAAQRGLAGFAISALKQCDHEEWRLITDTNLRVLKAALASRECEDDKTASALWKKQLKIMERYGYHHPDYMSGFAAAMANLDETGAVKDQIKQSKNKDLKKMYKRAEFTRDPMLSSDDLRNCVQERTIGERTKCWFKEHKMGTLLLSGVAASGIATLAMVPFAPVFSLVPFAVGSAICGGAAMVKVKKANDMDARVLAFVGSVTSPMLARSAGRDKGGPDSPSSLIQAAGASSVSRESQQGAVEQEDRDSTQVADKGKKEKSRRDSGISLF